MDCGALIGLAQIAKPTNLVDRGGVWFSTANLSLRPAIDMDLVPARKPHVALEPSALARLQAQFLEADTAIAGDKRLEGSARFHVGDPFANRPESLGRLPDDPPESR